MFPLDTKAKLTLVANEPESAEEIMEAAPNSTLENVYFVKTNYLMRVHCSYHQSANKIKEKGIYFFNLFITPW